MEAPIPVQVKDGLAAKHGEYELVLTNPPFGKKSSVTIVNDAGETSKESLTINRDDFWATTSNKQLNFLQHVFTILKQHGRAAVVVPDNVLFEGGAGETIRRELLKQADVHTLLRLPTGIFYAQGVKANVLFFDRKPAADKQAWTTKLWIYDLRTNLHFTLKENPLKRADLDDFVACYSAKDRTKRKESERWKSFTYEELLKRDKVNLDLFWLKDDSLEDSANLPDPMCLHWRSSRTSKPRWSSSRRFGGFEEVVFVMPGILTMLRESRHRQPRSETRARRYNAPEYSADASAGSRLRPYHRRAA
jgi:type I restriction enzyme M protein